MKIDSSDGLVLRQPGAVGNVALLVDEVQALCLLCTPHLSDISMIFKTDSLEGDKRNENKTERGTYFGGGMLGFLCLVSRIKKLQVDCLYV
jgi:hypothetical protein